MDPRTGLLLGCLVAGLAWLALGVAVLLGRTVADRRMPGGSGQAADPGRGAGLARRAAGLGRTRRWARARALVELGRAGGQHVRPWIYRRALRSRDPEIRAAAVRGLAPLAPAHEWAIDLLVLALREELIPRSRVAAHLDLLEPHLADALGELLDDDVPAVRYWAGLLLARYPGLHAARLERRLRDPDASVRRAAVETLGVRGERTSLPAVLALLGDEAMFVRAHACRSAGRLGGVGVAARLVPLLGDREWWVRTAAKDTLRGLGDEVLTTLVPVLESPDRFARNGAAEVLQDLRLLDRFVATFPDAPLVQTIYDAGEEGLRRAAEARIHDGEPAEREVA